MENLTLYANIVGILAILALFGLHVCLVVYGIDYSIFSVRKHIKFSSMLPWWIMPREDVVMLKCGSFMAIYEYRGPDHSSSTQDEVINFRNKMNNMLRRFQEDACIYVEARRVRTMDYIEYDGRNKNAKLFEKLRRKRFVKKPKFETRYYLCIMIRNPDDFEARSKEFFFTKPEGDSGDSMEGLAEKRLQDFMEKLLQVEELLGNDRKTFAFFRRLKEKEILEFLHGTVSTKHHGVGFPPAPAYLDELLCDQTFYAGVNVLRLDDTFIKVVGIKDFGDKTSPGFLQELDALPFEYRLNIRYIVMDREKAVKKSRRFQRDHLKKKKSLAVQIGERLNKTESPIIEKHAVTQSEDLGDLRAMIQSCEVNVGYTTTVVIVWDKDLEAVKEKARTIEGLLNKLEFTTFDETINAPDAFLGAIPGLTKANVRRPPVDSRNACHLFPLMAYWPGPKKNKHLKGEPLLLGVGAGNTLFRLVTHVGQIGHTLVFGPTGAGKSFLASMMAISATRYNPDIIIFDKDRSCMCATLSMEGDFYDLGKTNEVPKFQPLRFIDESRQEFDWCFEFIANILSSDNFEITPEARDALFVALNHLKDSPPESRTITDLMQLVKHDGIKKTLMAYTSDGPYGMIDQAEDTLKETEWMAFEMGGIWESPKLVKALLSYLFHRIDRRLATNKGKPTFIFLDECWMFLDNEQFRLKMKIWAKTLRKYNASLVILTQSIDDALKSKIFDTLYQSCQTVIFLPDQNANRKGSEVLYDYFDFNEKERRILAEAQAQEFYYYRSSLGRQLFSLKAGPVESAICGSSAPQDFELIESVRDRVKGTEKKFMVEFLKEKGIEINADSRRLKAA